MTRLLTFFGYTEYQAQCVAPVLWFVLIACIVMGAAIIVLAIACDEEPAQRKHGPPALRASEYRGRPSGHQRGA